MTDIPNEHNQDSQSDNKGAKEAAFMRALPRALKNLIRFKPAGGLAGTLPRVPAKTIAKAADKLGKGFDIKGSVEDSMIKKTDEKTQFRLTPKRSAQFVYVLGKATILGTILFQVYEESLKYLAQLNYSLFWGHSNQLISGAAAFIAGSAAGVAHGGLSAICEKLEDRTKSFQHCKSMFFRHILSHGILFFSYHQWCILLGFSQIYDEKYSEDNHSNRMSQLPAAFKVFTSGAIAGILQDCVSHKYAGEKIPPMNQFRGVAITSGIMFVAWEFSKSTQFKEQILKGFKSSLTTVGYTDERKGKRKQE